MEWLERYKAGEYAAVWAEMQALGVEISKRAYSKAAEAVLRETMARARNNVLRLFAELPKLGYRFLGAPEPEPDYPLELRLEHALAYVRERGGVKYKANPWAHPALAWVDDEQIEVPARFRDGRPGRASYLPPSRRRMPGPAPLAIRRWFEIVGSVDLSGTHPALNRDGKVAALRVTLATIETGTPAMAGADFVAAIRHAFDWGGFPGWAEREERPERELNFLRSKLVLL